MKHVTFADKSLLMGDEAADTLLEYARLLADSDHADSVTLAAISTDGNTVDVSFLLNANSILVIESTNSEVQAPANDDVVRELRARIAALTQPFTAATEAPRADPDYDAAEFV